MTGAASSGLVIMVMFSAFWTAHLVISTPSQSDTSLLPWLKFWAVMGLVFCLDRLTSSKVSHRPSHRTTPSLQTDRGLAPVILLVVVWCAAPLQHNGAEVLFDSLVVPLHGLVMTVRDVSLSTLDLLLEDLLQPLVTGWQLHLLPLLQDTITTISNSPTYILQFLETVLHLSEATLMTGLDWMFALLSETLNIIFDPVTGLGYYSSVLTEEIQTGYHKIKLFYIYNEENPVYFSTLYKTYRKIFIKTVLHHTDTVRTSITKPLPVLLNSMEQFSTEICRVREYYLAAFFAFEIPRLFNVASDSFISFSSSTHYFISQASLFSREAVLRYLKMFHEISWSVVRYLHNFTFVYSKENETPPRLFSQVLKEMIKQLK